MTKRPDQIALISAICREVSRQGFGQCDQERIDAIIAAASLVVSAFEKPGEGEDE